MSASNSKALRLTASALRLTVSLAVLTLCVFRAHAPAQTPQRPRTAVTPAAPPVVSPSPAPAPDPAQPATPAPSPAREVSEDEADLVITANVTARELKFETVPNPSVEFTGKPERVTIWEAERTNLPRPVQPGVTYRDIGIRLKIVSVFADIDRIVAEALGEVPESDDAPPAPAAPPATAPAEAATPSDVTPDERAATLTGDAVTGASAAPPAATTTTAAARAGAAHIASPRRAAARPRARRLP